MIYLTTVTACRLTCASNSFPVWQTFNGSHSTKPCEMSCGTVKFMLVHFINKPYTSSSTPFNFNLTLSPLYPEGISSSFLSTDNTSTGVCVQYNSSYCMIADLRMSCTKLTSSTFRGLQNLDGEILMNRYEEILIYCRTTVMQNIAI